MDALRYAAIHHLNDLRAGIWTNSRARHRIPPLNTERSFS
jgi:hypothetical protein